MMHECYKDNWATFLIDEEKRVFKIVWHDNGTLTAQKYKEILLLAKEMVEKYRPEKNLSDGRNFRLAVSPELQTWIATHVFQKKGNEILKQYALVLSESVIAQISLEQMMEESNRDEMTRYFDNIEEAEKWLGL